MTALADGDIELLVPVPTASGRQGVRGRRQAVRAGTVLARSRRTGWSDVPRMHGDRGIRLHSGPNTEVNAEGTELRALCDGEVRLRNLLIEVVPMYVHEGDLAGRAALIRSLLPVFVTGSVVDGAAIDAEGEVYIAGSLHDAQVISRDGDISVVGTISGSASAPSVLHADGDITCGPLAHGRLIAGGDIRLLVDARHTLLKATGGLYLPQSIERSLIDVTLHVEGGLYPPIMPLPAPLLPGPDRQHVRVATLLNAYVALHAPPPISFRACTLLDVSTRGARCRVDPPMYELEIGTVVQLRFLLPGSADPLMAIARVARAIGTGVVGLAFMQMMRRDEDRLTTFCLQMVLVRSRVDLAHPTARRGTLPA